MNYVVKLRDNCVINDCEQKLAEFCKKDFSYRRYDLPTDVTQDADLTEGDIRFANRILARMGPQPVRSILDRKASIDLALSHIPSQTSICGLDSPWTSLGKLFDAILGPGVGPPRATKILYKKRPNLIPILDSVVLAYCRDAYKDLDSSNYT